MKVHGSKWLAPLLLAACAQESEPTPALDLVPEPAAADFEIPMLMEPEAGRGELSLLMALTEARAPAPDATRARIVTRDHELWVLPGRSKKRYTVKDRQGKVLAEEVDEAHLCTEFSYLHNLLHPEYRSFFDVVGD